MMVASIVQAQFTDLHPLNVCHPSTRREMNGTNRHQSRNNKKSRLAAALSHEPKFRSSQNHSQSHPAARFAKISNAGNVFPSSTSRNAPPPVEI